MLMLLDSAGLYFRAFHAIPESITAPDGTPVNAVRGFLDMTAALVATRRPTGLVACWDDDWRPQWRVDLLDSYKTHRALGDGGGADARIAAGPGADHRRRCWLPWASRGSVHPGFEADDVIGTLARRHGARGEPVEVVTGDRDLIQLVDDDAGHPGALHRPRHPASGGARRGRRARRVRGHPASVPRPGDPAR